MDQCEVRSMGERFRADNAPAGENGDSIKMGVPAEREILNRLCSEAISYDRGDPKRIQHFVKVHAFAKLIAEAEGIGAHARFVLEAAAYLHDIGIHKARIFLEIAAARTKRNSGPARRRRFWSAAGSPSRMRSACAFSSLITTPTAASTGQIGRSFWRRTCS